MKLEIKTLSLQPRHARVLLDGIDISSSLRALKLIIDRNEANSATIWIDIDEIDVDAEPLAALHAYLDAKRPYTLDHPGDRL